MKKIYSLSRILVLAMCLIMTSLHHSTAQCILQGTISEPGCTAGTNTVTQSNVGGMQEWNLNSTTGGDYTVSISAGNNGCGAYSVSPSSFTAAGSTTTVDILAGGTCCWAASGTSAVLTYTKIVYTNTTSNAPLCQGTTRALTVSPAPVTPGSWSVIAGTGTGSISGTTFTPGNAGTVTVRYTKGGCNSDVSFTIDPLPSASAGGTSSATVCASNNTYTIPAGYSANNGTISWTSSGDGSFTNGNTTTPIYTFGTNDKTIGGLVTLTMHVSNGLCPDATATFGLTITPQPTATAGATSSASACATANFYTIPAGYTSTHGTISWSATTTSGTLGLLSNGTTLTPTYTFSGPDKTLGATVTLTMTVSNAPCAAATTTFTLHVDPVPTATQGATNTATVCASTNSYAVPAGYGSSNGTISWSASSTSGTNGSISNGTTLTPTYNFSAADITSGATVALTMTVSNAGCSAATTTFTLNIVAAPIATQGATSTGTACVSNNFYTVPIGYGATNGSISWAASTTSGTVGSITNGNTLTPTYNFSAADIASGASVVLTMSVFNATCSPSSTTFDLTITPLPTATQGATNTATVCANSNSYAVPAGYGSSNGTITWTASSTSGTNGSISNANTLTPTYNFSAADIASGATVTLTMTVDDGGICTPATTTFSLIITPLPVATQGATSSATACANANVFTVPAGYSSANGTITWTASSTSATTGFITNPNTLTPTYNFSAADIASGATVTLTMTVADGGICPPASTTFTLTIDQLPVATAGPTTLATACASANSYTVPAGYSGNGNITWTASSNSGTTGTVSNPNIATPTYNFSPADIASGAIVTLTMTIDDGGVCPTSSTTFTLTIDPVPIATAPFFTSAEVCANANFYTIPAGYGASNGTITWTANSSSGTTGFISNPNTLTPTYNFSAADIANGATVIMTMTVDDGGVCTPATTTYEIDIFALPAATTGAVSSAAVCASTQSYTVPAGYGAANGGILWTASSTSATTGTLTNASTLTPTYTFSQDDSLTGATVTLTLTVDDDLICPDANATFTLTIYQDPTPATAGSLQNICGSFISGPLGGNTPTVGTGTWTQASGPGVTFFSNVNSGTTTASVTAPGLYAFAWTIATGGGTCTSVAYDTVNYYSSPTTATVGPDQNICGSLTSGPLGGNNPSVGTGTWIQTAGPGTTTFSYPDSGISTATVTVLGSYTYQWTISNGTCIPSSASVNVNFIASPSGGTIANTSYCSSTGTGVVSVTGVANANQYSWALPAGLSGSSTGSTITVGGTVAGNYTVTVTPQNVAFGVTCSGTPVTGIVSLLALPTIDSVRATVVACFGGTDTINVYATSANGNLQYSIDGGTTYSNTTGSFTGIGPGNYNIYVRDDSSCSVGYGANPIVVTAPRTSLSATSIVTPIGCTGDSNGAINLLASGGVGGYVYSWSSGQSIQIISGLPAGIYVGSVTDGNGCMVTVTDTLLTPTPIVTSITHTNVTCYGSADGTANLTISGGVAPYAILWDNFDTTADIRRLSSGTYRVRVTDAYGCEHSDSVKIRRPALLTGTLSVTNVSCFGSNVDSIVVNATGGNAGGYTYAWTPSVSTTNSVTNVAPGEYVVTVTDIKGCTFIDSATITQPLSGLTATSVFTPLTCSGDSNGSINLLASGGTGGYLYTWSSGQTTEIISGLPAGTYVGSVTDGNGCVATSTTTLLSLSPIVSSIADSNVTCYDAGNGKAFLTVSGGVSPYSILWSNFDTTANIARLAAGIYRVRITDANGCVHDDSVRIKRPPLLTGTLSVTNVSCFGSNVDSIVVTATGGNPGGYTYAWTPSVSITNSISNVAPGEYVVTVTDSKGCTFVDSAAITQPLSALTISSVVNQITCNNANNGSIEILTSGGVGGYTYSWATGQSTSVINGLSAGPYAVTVTDANGCTAALSFTITNPSMITSSVVGVNATCAGAANGSATLTVNGGTPGYTYLWSNFDTSQNLSNIPAGLYRVIIKDSNGCEHYDSVIITEPQPMTAVVTVRNIYCLGNTGSVVVTVSGGTPGIGGYNYTWSPIASSVDSVSGVGAGTYTVTANDANGCSVTASGTVTQVPSTLSATSLVTDMDCHNANDGAITVLASGGAGAYTYAWTSSQTTSTITGLAAGPYTVTVTDGNGCTISLTDTIHNPLAITSSIVGTNVTCAGASNGSATLTVSGGTPGYTYLWSNFDTSQNLTNVVGDLYRVIITDSKGCRHYDSVVIAEPRALTTTVRVRNVLCFGAANGSVVVSVAGGTPAVTGYTYTWSPVASSVDSVSGVGPGTYTVVATDSNGCTVTASGTVTQPASGLTVLSNVVNVSCGGTSNGSISLSVNGGTPGYTYLWNNGQRTQNITGLSAGIDTVTVTDANGCSVVVIDTVKAPTPITSSIVGTNVTCAGADNGTATLTVGGGTLPYTFLWSDFSGAQNRDSLHAGWYYVIITDGYGCQKRDSVKILEPLPLVLSDTIIPVSCTNANNGSIHIITSGGTGSAASFTYTWTPAGPNSPDNTNLSSGTYTVTVSDSNHCTASLTIQLANPAPLTIASSVIEPKCFGQNNGSIDVIVGGGTPQYTYAWTPAGPNSSLNSNIAAGTYDVTVTDSRGCHISDTIVVNQPGAMYISGIQKNVSCHGLSDGYLLPTGYGGTQPYSYQWYLGTDTFAPQGPITENITQLPGGDYYLVITDANGCMAPFTRRIIDPDSLIVTLSDTNAGCNGSATGSVLASVRGGTTPYQYLWNNFTTDSFQRNIPAGTYTVVVTDSNGCHQNKAITVSQSPALVVVVTDTNPSCASSNNGSISLSVSGGRPTYTYSWNTTPVQTTATISNLAAGSYTVTITDLNGCSQTETVVLTAPSPLEVNTAISNPTCSGGDNGFVSLDVRGGTAPYLYNWSTTPAQTGNVASALSAGTYYATVTDSHGCVLLDTALVVSPQPIVVTIGVNSSTCPGSNVGIVVVTATGGLAPYNYALGSITQASDTFRNLGVGTYSVVVTDINGCQGDAPLTVGAVGTFTDTLTASPNVILAGEIVHLYARASTDTGTTITSYIWFPADSMDFSGCGSPADCDSPTVRPTQTQDYIVTVVNARGCRITDTVHVTVSNQPSVFIPLAFTPNGDGLNDRFEFDILGATTVNVQIWNRWGELVYSNPSQPNGIDNISGWDGTFRGQLAAYDTYTYQFDVTYYDGHHQTIAGTVTILR